MSGVIMKNWAFDATVNTVSLTEHSTTSKMASRTLYQPVCNYSVCNSLSFAFNFCSSLNVFCKPLAISNTVHSRNVNFDAKHSNIPA
jgi:hypothetical protein